MASVLIVFGSSTGATEAVARKVADEIGDAELLEVSRFNIDVAAGLKQYSLVLLGASTWGFGDLQDDFHAQLDVLEGAALSGVRVGVFGTGDQENYADTFVDALGILAQAAQKAGALLVGATSTDGYTYAESRAVQDGKFVGLAIDVDNQNDLTDERISAWVAQLNK